MKRKYCSFRVSIRSVFAKRLSLRISVKFVQTEITFIPFPILYIRLFCRKYQTGPNFIPVHRQTSILFSSVSHDGERRDARQNIFFPGPINEKQASDRFSASMMPICFFFFFFCYEIVNSV